MKPITLYEVEAAVCAPLTGGHIYGTPRALQGADRFRYALTLENNAVRADGAFIGGVTTIVGATLTLQGAALDRSAWALLTGATGSPEALTVRGGVALPSVGVIVVAVALDGLRLVTGFPRALPTSLPGYETTRDGIRVGELTFAAYAAPVPGGALLLSEEISDPQAVPDYTTAAAFNGWLGAALAP